jgi:hypothetical protein
MRRGQERKPAVLGLTKSELLDACELSARTFDTLRKTARVAGPSHGGLTHVFPNADVIRLIKTAEGGRYRDHPSAIRAARGWRGLLTERGVHVPTEWT